MADYVNPDFEPYIGDSFKGTWIEITSYELKQQTAFVNGEKGGIIVDPTPALSWKFLAPNQIMETINNTWEPWETISSRMAGKGKELVQLGNELSGVWEAMGQVKHGINYGTVGKIYKKLTNITKAKFKVDTPLVYENTERREWTMEFNLSSVNPGGGLGKGSAEKMLESVRMLESSSTPVRTDAFEGLGIEFPYVFTIESKPDENLMNVEYAALTSVQPTFKAPYDENGRPMMIDLTLTFKELSPVYSDSFE